MIRMWNRLTLMSDERITKKVFNHEYVNHRTVNNWSHEVEQVMNSLNLSDYFESKSIMYLSEVDDLLCDFYCKKWQLDVQKMFQMFLN